MCIRDSPRTLGAPGLCPAQLIGCDTTGSSPRIRQREYPYHISLRGIFPKRQTCESLLCSECKRTPAGREYMGTASTTISGRTCQAWSSNTPHVPNSLASNDTNYPDGSRAAAMNYCRNPDWDPEPWCYTTDPSKRWEYCGVPLCSGRCILIYRL